MQGDAHIPYKQSNKYILAEDLTQIKQSANCVVIFIQPDMRI